MPMTRNQHPKDRKTDIDRLAAMVVEAAGNRPWVSGYAVGKSPRYFVVGDSATIKDAVLDKPFSGLGNEVLANLYKTMAQKDGSTPDDFFITLLVKAFYQPSELREQEVMERWLPIARLEFALSGCESVIAIGKMSAQLAGHISASAVLTESKPISLIEQFIENVKAGMF